MSDIKVQENKIVHESADERQHVRIDIPAKFKVVNQQASLWCSLDSISLGGFSFFADQYAESKGDALKVDDKATALISIKLGSIDIQMEIAFIVVESHDGRFSAKFDDIEKDKHEVLRYIIRSYLSGEFVNVNGVINILQRENFVRERKGKNTSSRSKQEQLRAIIGTSAFALGAITVISILLFKVYGFLFTVSADHGFVSADGHLIKMPDNGYIEFLIKPDTKEVTKGQPLAVVSTQLITNLNSPEELKALNEINEDDMSVLLGKTLIETSINSPCDCFVMWESNSNERFSYKEERLLYLIPKDAPLFIEAAFNYKDIEKIDNDLAADLSISYDSSEYVGSIRSARVNTLDKVIKLEINVDQEIPIEALWSPAVVKLRPSL